MEVIFNVHGPEVGVGIGGCFGFDRSNEGMVHVQGHA